MRVKSESEVAQSCPTLSDPIDCIPTRLLRPWDFPDKSTGVGCHCIDLEYCDIEWFALDMNKDHSVIFEIASKYCILVALGALEPSH